MQGLMKDLIERRAAINAADRADYTGLAVEDVKKVTDEVVKELKQLPSAQPEIIHCKDCKWHNGEINQCNAQICASMCGEDFCSKGERREDERSD